MPQSGPREQPAGRESRRQLFEREVTRLMDRLYGTALRLTRDADDAEDTVAEAVARAWAKLDQLADEERIEGWLFQILNTTFVDRWRRRRHREDLETGIDSAASGSDGEAEFSLFAKLHGPFLLWWSTPEENFVNDLLHDDIRQAVDSLPDAFRIVFVLVELQGYRYEEVATLLDVPLGTVRSRLSRGRGLLQQALWKHARDAGLIDEDAGCPGHVRRR